MKNCAILKARYRSNPIDGPVCHVMGHLYHSFFFPPIRCESVFNRVFRHGNEFARIVPAVINSLSLRIARLTSRITARDCTRAKFTQPTGSVWNPQENAQRYHDGRWSIGSYSLVLHFDQKIRTLIYLEFAHLCRFSPHGSREFIILQL